MADWDTANLVRRCKFKTRRPDAGQDEEMLDPDLVVDGFWYDLLTEAQDYWTDIMASTVPEALYGPPTLMQTADGGATWYFGSPAANPKVYPIGHLEIRESRSGRVMIPGTDWQSKDFVMEGDHIRLPNGKSKLFSAGPYARFVTRPSGINAATEPTIQPPGARILLVNRACILWCSQGGGMRDSTAFEKEEAMNWNRIVNALRTQFHLAGAQAVDDEGGDWWHGIDTGEGYTRWQ